MERSQSQNRPATHNPTALFVYGTLRRGFDNPFARRLRREAEFLSPATLPGAFLVDLGAYPGMLRGNNSARAVAGDLFRLPANPAPLLAALDAYEGCSDDPSRPGEYVRETARVIPDQGPALTAWIYLFNRDTTGLPVVPNGDYLAYATE